MNKLLLLISIALPLSACASSMPEERKDYILSRPHGFIEITINDSNIPNIIQRYDDDKKLTKPSSCTLSVSANSEPFFSQAVYPDGSEPPYKVSSGFRFPMPIGLHHLMMSYYDCRANDKNEANTINTSTDINIQNNMVYEIVFTDSQIIRVVEKTNDDISLKQILEAVKK